jgi:mannonate dehydratase
VSNQQDIDFLLGAADSNANGLTLCTGSLGAGARNDLPAMARRFASRTHFVHLRNVSKEPDGSFQEADHLGGDVDMVSVMSALLHEQARRREAGDPHWRLPFRPDHGHELLDDTRRKTHPGYPLIGRLRGLAELRGVMVALASVQKQPL